MENEYNKKIKILHVAQAAGGVDRYLRTLLKYLDKDKFENIVVLSQDFKKEDYKDIADTFISIKMETHWEPCEGCPYGKHTPCLGYCIVKAMKEVKEHRNTG